MPGVFLVNSLDASRALGPKLEAATPEMVEHFFMSEYLSKGGGRFNHDPSIRATGDLFRGRIRTPEAVHYCLTRGSPPGREQNAEIVRLVGPYAEANRSIVHKIGFLAIAIGRYKGRTIFLGVKAPYVRVCGPSAFLVIPGFRKSFLPSDDQIRFSVSLAHLQVARDDLAGIDTEYLYAGPAPDHGGRTFRPILASSGSVLSIDAVDDLLQVYVSGVVRILDRGLGQNRARLSGYRIVDRGQDSLF